MATESIAPEESGLPAQEVALEAENQQPESDFNGKTVSVAALLGAKTTEGSTENKAISEKGKPDASGATQKPKDGERTFTQAELNRILSERLNEERQKPAYQYGQTAISARAKREGITESEAYSRIRNEENARIAKEYAENPEKAYNDMLNGTFNPYAQQPPAQPTQQNTNQYRYTPESVAESLQTMDASGTLPPGFTAAEVTDAFVIDAMQNGPEAALYRWLTSNPNRLATKDGVLTELERRKNLPKPMQSGGGNVSNRPVAIKGLTKEEFKKLDEEVAKGNRSGLSVRIED